VKARKLVTVLSESDREHLKKILNSSISVTPAGVETTAKVHRFLQSSTYIETGSSVRFKELPADERERLLSELLWRLTCYLDGSETAVLGAVTYELGGGFVANQVEQEGKTFFCLASAAPKA
jgi:hypothetical protein